MRIKFEGGIRDADALAERQLIGTKSIVLGRSEELNAVDERCLAFAYEIAGWVF